MPPKKRKSKKQKRKSLDEVENISHSDSTNNLNNQSESTWECPRSTLRRLTPKSTPISDRRRSLRSATMFNDTGTTSLSRCIQLQNSRGHSSASCAPTAPGDIQLLDVPADTINSAYQVPEGSDQVESPSKYLVQVVYPLTLEPELEQKEAENVGNSAMGIPEMVEEEDEAEKSWSNHSNQMGRQNTFEKESIPLEQEPVAGETESSSKNHKKSISRAGCSSPSFSLRLTEMVGIVEDEDEEVADSDMPKDTTIEYQVKPEFVPILKKIIGKHGDIAKNCAALSVKTRSKLLELVCEVISELEFKDVSNIKQKDLKSMIGVIGELKIMEVEVEWLEIRLTDILEARQILKQASMLKEKTDKNRKDIESVEIELEECEARKKLILEKLGRVKDESTRISQTVRYAKSKVRRFLNCSLMNDLL